MPDEIQLNDEEEQALEAAWASLEHDHSASGNGKADGAAKTLPFRYGKVKDSTGHEHDKLGRFGTGSGSSDSKPDEKPKTRREQRKEEYGAAIEAHEKAHAEWEKRAEDREAKREAIAELGSIGYSDDAIRQLRVLDPESLANRKLPRDERQEKVEQYTQHISEMFADAYGGLPDQMKKAGFAERDVEKVQGYVEKGKAKIEKAALRHNAAREKAFAAEEALEEHEAAEPQEPEEPDEPDPNSYGEGDGPDAAFERDHEKWQADHPSWEKDRAKWDKDNDRWEEDRDKLSEKVDDLDGKASDLQSDLDSADTEAGEKINEILDGASDRLTNQLDKEESRDYEPDEPDEPDWDEMEPEVERAASALIGHLSAARGGELSEEQTTALDGLDSLTDEIQSAHPDEQPGLMRQYLSDARGAVTSFTNAGNTDGASSIRQSQAEVMRSLRAIGEDTGTTKAGKKTLPFRHGKVKDDSGHEHDELGRFGSGGRGGKEPDEADRPESEHAAWEKRAEQREAKREAAFRITGGVGHDKNSIRQLHDLDPESAFVRDLPGNEQREKVTEYTGKLAEMFADTFGGLPEQMSKVGLAERDVVKVQALVVKGKERIAQAAEKYTTTKEKFFEAKEAFYLHEQDKPSAEPVSPDEPDPAEYTDEAAYARDKKKYDADYAAWEKEYASWDREFGRWEGKSEKLFSKMNSLEERAVLLQGQMEEVEEEIGQKINEALEVSGDRFTDQLQAEEESDLRPEEPEEPEEKTLAFRQGKVRDAVGHEHAADGRFGSGGGAKKPGSDKPGAKPSGGAASTSGAQAKKKAKKGAASGKEQTSAQQATRKGAMRLAVAGVALARAGLGVPTKALAKLGAMTPVPVKAPVLNAWHAVHAICMAGNNAMKGLATRLAEEKGLPPERLASLTRMLTAIDVSFQAAAFTTFLGAEAVHQHHIAIAAKVASYVPVASTAYVVASGAKNPIKVAKTALSMLKAHFPDQIKGAAAFAWGALRHPLTVAAHEEHAAAGAGHKAMDRTNEQGGSESLEKWGSLVAEHLAAASDPDLWEALFAVAFDDVRDVEEAIHMADTCLADQGETPEDDAGTKAAPPAAGPAMSSTDLSAGGAFRGGNQRVWHRPKIRRRRKGKGAGDG